MYNGIMKKKLFIIIILTIALIVLSSVIISRSIKKKSPLIEQRPLPDSYIACGCGCCSQKNPTKKCLYRSNGDDIGEIIERDKELANSNDCRLVGCSYPIEYTYCDNDAIGNEIEGRVCGGFAANLPEMQCPSGYTCQSEDDYPDAAGICVKD